MEGQEKNNIGNTKDSKLKITFAVFVMFVLMTAIAVVFLGVEMPSQQQENQQQELEIETSDLTTSNLSELVEEIESQSSSFLDKTKATTTTTTTTIGKSQESNPFSELSCDQLADIAFSFEDGWGSALAEFSVRCEMDNVDDFLK